MSIFSGFFGGDDRKLTLDDEDKTRLLKISSWPLVKTAQPTTNQLIDKDEAEHNGTTPPEQLKASTAPRKIN